ncbi:MAG: tetratricopeptide repeat protein [Pseudomonadota bacterium]
MSTALLKWVAGAALACVVGSGAAWAEWTPEADTCARHPDPNIVIEACTVALDSGKLTTEESARTLANRAWGKGQVGDNHGARSDVKEAIRVHERGGRASAWNTLGTIEEALGDQRAAEDAYLKALAQLSAQGGESISAGDATGRAARGNLAWLYDGQGRRAEAERYVRELYAIAPDYEYVADLYRKYGLK